LLAATRAADHHFGIRNVIIAFALATATGFTLLGFTDKLWLIVALTVFTAFSHTPAMALLDAYALRGLKARGRAYGPVRLWGSASFIVANLAAGLAFDVIDTRNLIWLLSVSAIATAMAALWLMPLPPPAPLADPAQAGRALWRSKGFLAVVIAASLVQSSHAAYYGFSTIAWKAAGFDDMRRYAETGSRPQDGADIAGDVGLKQGDFHAAAIKGQASGIERFGRSIPIK
jgi:PPP family 3-phenylpropionic acid transporter